MYILSQPQYYHIQQRLRDEVRANLPSPTSGAEVTAEMLDKLPYLDAVAKEIMRFRAPVPQAKRIAVRDTEICGYKIPKGTRVGIMYWAINQSKQLWGEDAREFNPERWLVGEQKATGGADNLAFSTFGTGIRGCIGRGQYCFVVKMCCSNRDLGFAIGENKALLATLIGSFDIKPVGGKHADIEMVWGVTARMVGGLNVEVTVIEGW